jgi:hypothetical protein
MQSNGSEYYLGENSHNYSPMADLKKILTLNIIPAAIDLLAFIENVQMHG